jgi:site-specific DNA-cytosine methylase
MPRCARFLCAEDSGIHITTKLLSNRRKIIKGQFMTIQKEITHFHLFCGLGGGAKGFNKGQARVGNMEAKFVCVGGIDNDASAIRDFERLAGVPGTVLDMFSREQYIAFHGKEPPADWREATPEDIRRAAGYRRPNIVFLSAPCKGFSGLLSETRSKTDKYQALNALTLRGIWLMLEAWKDDPIELMVFENVPRIANRGRPLLDQIGGLLTAYGYAKAETTHDCGELGGLAQSRKRFLLVARHQEKVPPFLYEPEKKRLRAVGDILGRMPLPGDALAGPMHRIPSLAWKTWVRLAFVEAGSDWRSLNKLEVLDGYLRDYLIIPEGRNGFMGVNQWDEPSGTVAGASRVGNGAFSIADPRLEQSDKWPDGQAFGVRKWDEATGTVTSKNIPGQGPYSVADPRPHFGDSTHHNVYRIVKFDEHSRTVTADFKPTSGGGVADPRAPEGSFTTKFHVAEWDGKTKTVIGGHGLSNGAFGVADPRPNWEKRYGNLAVMDYSQNSNTVIAGGKGVQGGYMSVADPRWRENTEHYKTGGHYGVMPWDSSSGAVSAAAGHDNGRWSVADPRLPSADQKMVAIIRALDGTWHRPFTTLELAALQSLVDPEEQLALDGLSDSAWRERIGNAVPPDAAAAIAGVMGTTLLLAWSGQTFMLSSSPIWVRPIAVALAVNQADIIF